MLVGCLFYAGFGGLLQWFPIWLGRVGGLDAAAIGLMMAVAGVARMVTGPLVAAWADGRSDRRTPLRALALVALAAVLALRFVRTPAAVMLLAVLVELGFWLLIAFVEAAVVRLCPPGGFPGYGFARGAASLSFVCGNIAVGALVDSHGPQAIWWWLLLSVGGIAAATLALAPERGAAVAPAPFTARLVDGLAMVRRRRFLLLMVGCGLIQAAHQFYYLYATRLWMSELGLSAAAAGWLFAFGVVAEAAFLMLVAPRLGSVSPALLVAVGGAAGALRWLLMAAAPGLPLLILLQALHALSFTCAFLGGIRGVVALWGHARAPTAQLVYMTLANAPAQAAASAIAGFLFVAGGAAAGYGAMALISLGGAVAGWLWWRLPEEEETCG